MAEGTSGRSDLGAMLPSGRAVVLRGRGRAYVREIAGPPGAPTLVLLHGLGATSAVNWLPVFVPLGRRYHVVAIDQRGHGRGVRSFRPFSLADCADDVVAVADELGLEQVIPVGYSMGGPVALLARRRHPDRVTGLVLCATSAVFGGDNATPSPFAEAFTSAVRLTPLLARQFMLRYFLSSVLSGADRTPIERLFSAEAARHDPAAIMEARAAILRFDARTWASELAAPTSVVLTAQDALVAPALQLDLARRTKAAVFVVEGGHDAVLRHRELFISALLAACQSVVARSQLAPV